MDKSFKSLKTKGTNGELIHLLWLSATWLTGKLLWNVICPHYVCLFRIQISSPCFGFCFLSLSGLEEDSSTPAAVRWRAGRRSGSRWWPREEIVGLQWGDGFLSLLPECQNNRLICGRERPQVANRTCFPLLKSLIEQAWGEEARCQLLIRLLGAGVKQKAGGRCVTSQRRVIEIVAS